MISSFEVGDSSHVHVETLSKDGPITLIIIDDDYTSPEEVIRKLKAESGIKPDRVIWLSFCKAHEFFAQSDRLRKITAADQTYEIDVAYTLVLLDLRADQGRMVWDFKEKKCVELDAPEELYGLEMFEFAIKQGYQKEHIGIYSGYEKSRTPAEARLGGLVFQKHEERFTNVLMARIAKWPIALEKVIHKEWRNLRTTEKRTNHWPDEPPLNETIVITQALQWANKSAVFSHSIQEILMTTGYYHTSEPQWGFPRDLIPAIKWIAVQTDTAGLGGEKSTCGGLRYFNYLAGTLSKPTLTVSIVPHFKYLDFNPYPFALWLSEISNSFKGMTLKGEEKEGETCRTNDSYMHVDLIKRGDSLVGSITEGFIWLNSDSYPLNPTGERGRGMPNIINAAALCGIPKLWYYARTGKDAVETRIINTSDHSVIVGNTTCGSEIGENEIRIEFEFDIGDK